MTDKEKSRKWSLDNGTGTIIILVLISIIAFLTVLSMVSLITVGFETEGGYWASDWRVITCLASSTTGFGASLTGALLRFINYKSRKERNKHKIAMAEIALRIKEEENRHAEALAKEGVRRTFTGATKPIAHVNKK